MIIFILIISSHISSKTHINVLCSKKESLCFLLWRLNAFVLNVWKSNGFLIVPSFSMIKFSKFLCTSTFSSRNPADYVIKKILTAHGESNYNLLSLVTTLLIYVTPACSIWVQLTLTTPLYGISIRILLNIRNYFRLGVK